MTSRSSMKWLEENDIEVLDWVGQSCDLNLIENCWTRLKQIIADMPACKNLDKLIKTIAKAWKKLDKDTAYLTALTDSMSQHVVVIIEANGKVIKY